MRGGSESARSGRRKIEPVHRRVSLLESKRLKRKGEEVVLCFGRDQEDNTHGGISGPPASFMDTTLMDQLIEEGYFK